MTHGRRYAGLAILFAAGVGAAAGWVLSESPAGNANRDKTPRHMPSPGPLPTAAEATASAVEASREDAAEDCLAALAATASSHSLNRQRLLAIDRFVFQQGDMREYALIEELAGYAREIVPLPRTISHRPPYSAPSPASGRLLSGSERRRLQNLLETGGVEALVASVDATLLQAHWTLGISGVGHLIVAHGEQLYAALPRVVNALPVGLHELAVAIESGVAPEDFLLLLDSADVDLAATWHSGANLAKVAAIRTRPAILRLLLARGVNPATRPPAYRAILDDVVAGAKRRGAAPTEAFADVVRQLIAAGAQPDLPSTSRILAEWLPEDSLPPQHPEAAALVDSLADAAATVAAIDAAWMSKINAARRLEQRCEAQLEDFERAAAAFQATDLAAKQRYQDLRQQRWLRAWRARERTASDEAAVPAAGGPRDALELATEDDRWQDALAIADRAGGSMHQELLGMALNRAAPVAVIVALAERLDSLPDDMIRSLGRRNDAAALAEALEPFGLNLHYVDEEGRNAFTTLVVFFRDGEDEWQFAEYLASRAVAVKPLPFGLDPLDQLLMLLAGWPEMPGGDRFARFLIDHGAPVEPSHVELAERLSMIDEQTYRRLIDLVPELAAKASRG